MGGCVCFHQPPDEWSFARVLLFLCVVDYSIRTVQSASIIASAAGWWRCCLHCTFRFLAVILVVL